MTQIVVDRLSGTHSTQAVSAPASPRAAAGLLDPMLPRPVRRRRPARGSGRSAGPILRPAPTSPTPAALRTPTVRARACRPPSPEVAVVPAATDPDLGWRLTDRGVALVLLVGLMIMVAALTVVGLTALRVTGGGYQASVSAGLPR